MLSSLRNILRESLMKLRSYYLQKVWKHNVDITSRISFSAFLDRTTPQNIFIGKYSLVARGAMILSHDYTRGAYLKTRIGDNCLIGANAIILPGVTIGNNVVVGAGSVVTKDIKSNSMAAGNPAKIIRSIKTDCYGKIISETSFVEIFFC